MKRWAGAVSGVLAMGALVAGCSVGGARSSTDAGPSLAADAGDPPGVGPERDGGAIEDAGLEDAGAEVLGPVDVCNPVCGPAELCAESGEGNGMDDDCDGAVDEDCVCPAINVTQPCFAGPPDRRGVGACTDGIQTCGEFLRWGECVHGVSPTVEVCDGIDNDCDGLPDDAIEDCPGTLVCPETQEASPLRPLALSAASIYSGDGASFTWSLDCPESVPAALCPAPADPSAAETTAFLAQSGTYRAHVEIVTSEGETLSCAWSVIVRGSGLRVELSWNTMTPETGGTDLDLHLHRWTANGVDTNWYAGDDCHYRNCRASSHLGPTRAIDWRGAPREGDHADTDELRACNAAPHSQGSLWESRGACYNPRLDVDMNRPDETCDPSIDNPAHSGFCAPENINLDQPVIGIPYRVMVNYYSDHGSGATTIPEVNIFCDGALRGTFGADPFTELRDGACDRVGGLPRCGSTNDHWLVADVVFVEAECGLSCVIYPIDRIVTGEPEAGSLGDPPVPFGPAWSCDVDLDVGTCTPPP